MCEYKMMLFGFGTCWDAEDLIGFFGRYEMYLTQDFPWYWGVGIMDIGSFGIGVFASLMATVIWCAGSKLWKNKNRLKLYGLTKVRPNDCIRISAAYLFRIKVHGKYLLIKGRRIQSQYQPVGGVYKYFKSASSFLNEISACPDDAMKSTSTDSDDLRVQLPRKNALRFIDWFDTRKEREVSTLREFREELIAPNYLSEDMLDIFNPEFIRASERQLRYSEHLKMHEILIHDVYEVRLRKEDQDRILTYVTEHPGETLILADKTDIDRKTIAIGGAFYAIASTAEKIL